MTSRGADSKLFEEVLRALLEQGLSVRFQARGASMSPAIRDGEIVRVTPVIVSKLRKDDIVLAKSNYGFRLHRIVLADHARDVFVTRGDCGQENDPQLTGAQILGVARAKEVRVGRKAVRADLKGLGGGLVRRVARVQAVLEKLLRVENRVWPRRESSSATRTSVRNLALVLGLFSLLLAASHVQAQVAVADPSTSGTAQITGTGTGTVNFNHTTAATANRLLVVGVSINLTNSNGTTVTGVTYNGTALSFVGAHNDAGLTRRVEMWSLLNPVAGVNVPIIVTVNVPTAATVGVVAGATTFSGADQTAPLGTFVSADGAAGGNSQLDVPSVVNGMVIDTLAIGGTRGITVPGPQVQQWNLTSGGNGNRDARASGSSRSGAPSVPISETFTGGTSNWSLGAISVNPTAADLGVSTSVATVQLGQNTVYKITVTNSGPSAANTISLTDTLAAGLTFVSVSSPTMTCSTPPITCTQATLASGATATVAVTVTAGASGSYANTATVTDSGVPPDPNTGNNTYVAVATVQSASCATVSQAGPGAPTGTVNTYYPGSASVLPGATSISLGAATGARNCDRGGKSSAGDPDAGCQH